MNHYVPDDDTYGPREYWDGLELKTVLSKRNYVVHHLITTRGTMVFYEDDITGLLTSDISRFEEELDRRGWYVVD